MLSLDVTLITLPLAFSLWMGIYLFQACACIEFQQILHISLCFCLSASGLHQI